MLVREIYSATGVANTTLDTGELVFPEPFGSDATDHDLPDMLLVELEPVGGAAAAASIEYRDVEGIVTGPIQAWTWPADALAHIIVIGLTSMVTGGFSRGLGGSCPVVPRGKITFPALGVGIQARVRILAYWFPAGGR